MKSLLAAVLATALVTPGPSLGAISRTVRVDAFASATQCSFNRILPDPSSRSVVAWESQRRLLEVLSTSQPDDFVIAELPPEGSNGAAFRRVSAVSDGERLEPLRWSGTGDRLLYRAGENKAGFIDAETLALSSAPDMDPLWSYVRIHALSHGDLYFYRNPEVLATLRRIDRESAPLRTAATIDRSAAFLVTRLGHGFNMIAYRSGRRWETGIDIAFADAPVLPDGAGPYPTFMGDQGSHRTFLPYAMPLPDLQSGRIVGRFGWERIERDGQPAVDLAPVFHQLINVKDAVANGDTLFALVDLEREMRVVRIRGREVRSWPLCQKTGWTVAGHYIAAPNSISADTPVIRSEVRFVPGASPARPGPFGYLYRPLRADGRLIVYLHGGPTYSNAERTVPAEVSAFTPHGISVLEVEYSGMLGGGLSLTERLPRLGLGALKEDVETISRWVRHSGFRRAFFLSDSFGGAAAVLAAIDHPDDYEQFFLRAPFLALRDPAHTPGRRQMLAPDAGAAIQLEYERAAMGGAAARLRLGAELEAYVRRLRPSPRLSFYFGGIDPASAVTDLPSPFVSDRSVMILPRTAHEDVPGNPAVTRDILAKMDASR